MRTNIALGLCLATVAAFGPRADAAVPAEFTVQGVLRDSTGALQTMPVHITTTFFDAISGGNKISTGTYDAASVPAVNGLFTQTFTLTGTDVTSLGASAAVWMAVQVGSDTFARQKVTPELYALFSKHAEQSDGLSSTCAGCVTNANLSSGIDGSKITVGTVAAANTANSATTATTATTANGIQGRAIANTLPTAGQALGWNNANMRWEPETVVTSINTGGGLVGGPITSSGTISLPTAIPSDRTLQGNITISAAGAPTNLAKLVVLDSIGNTNAIFGSQRPISLVSADSSIGFNTYYNGGWKVASGGAGTGYITLDGAGNFFFHTGNAPAANGAAVTETEKVAIYNNGKTEIDRSNLNDGRLDNGLASGAGLSFGLGSGEGLASRRVQGTAAPEDINGLDFYSNFALRMTLKNNGSLEIDRGDVNVGGLDGSNTGYPGLTFGHNSGEGIASQRKGTGNLGGLDFYTARKRAMFIDTNQNVYRQDGYASFGNPSDERLKDIHGVFQRGLKEIVALSTIRYNYKRGNGLGLESKNEHVGISAQALQRAIPEAVRPGLNGFLTVTIDAVLWTLVNAVKEQNADVTKIAQANARLAAENTELKARLAKLEGTVGEILAARDSQKPTRLARR